MSNPAKATIDLAALRSNYDLACSLAPASRTMAVIKANAYGHGALRCARALESAVPAFAVCSMEEALELREGGIDKPLLLLRPRLAVDELELASRRGFWLMAYEPSHVDLIIGQELPRPVTVWLKCDTGMHRLGVDPGRLAAEFGRLSASGNVKAPVVLATHLACADDVGNPFTDAQLMAFRAATGELGAPVSVANSAGLMAWPATHGDWNRPGIMLYGSSPMASPGPLDGRLTPVMHLRSEIIAVREIAAGETVGYTGNWRALRPSRIATVAVGYADGYPRHAPNGTPVLIGGRRAPLVGRVSMDMITVDVTDLPGAGLGDAVTLWGPGLPVDEVASASGTIGYELLTRMPGRAALEYR